MGCVLYTMSDAADTIGDGFVSVFETQRKHEGIWRLLHALGHC